MMRWMGLLLASLMLAACDYTEVEREIGYKGKARVNPWLAAERFAARAEYHQVRSLAGWESPAWDDVIWFLPASILSNESFARQMEEWVSEGGHLVLLVERADAETSDWSARPPEPEFGQPLLDLLERNGIQLKQGVEMKRSKVEFDDETFEVEAESNSSVTLIGEDPGVFASTLSGDGRVTVLTDARLFRNRWIGDHQHAELLDKLVQITEYEGNVAFVRGSSLSIWNLLGRHLWPVLSALAVLTGLWLWKNFTRFGPMESAADAPIMRGYEHHLEALGDFQWRLDRAAGLLAPMRAQIIERAQRILSRSGRRDDDFFQFIADRAGIPRERAFRALAETAPADAAVLTRTTADLQLLLQVLH